MSPVNGPVVSPPVVDCPCTPISDRTIDPM